MKESSGEVLSSTPAEKSQPRALGVKITRYQDIPQFTHEGNWECDFQLSDVWAQVEKWRSGEFGAQLNIDPDFQRAHVWTEHQQVAWLEFFLRGGKTGRILYFNCSGWMRKWDGPFEIVDGKQRLEAIRRFLHDEIRVFGSLHSEFTDRLRIHRTMRIHVNDLPTRAAVLQWYLEFNAGGTPHTDAELDRVRALLDAEKVTPT